MELVTAGLEHPSTWLGGLTIDSRECGDDELDPGEECDDGNHVDDDGCDWDCQIPDPPGKCGDGELDPGEQCDDGNDVDDDGCDSDCQFGAIPVPASSPASVAILAAALMIAAATRVLRSRARR